VDIPFIAAALEGFGTIFRGLDFRGSFQHGTSVAATPSKEDELESNKFNVRIGAGAAQLKSMEAEDVFPC
jgi:hypothetical protein